MNSPHLEENLSAYLAGELGPAGMQAAEAHLSECPECRKQLEALRGLDVMLSHAGSLEPSAGFVRGVMGRIDQDRNVIAFRSRRAIAWMAMTAMIAFFVFVIGYRQMHPPSGMAHHPKAQPKQEEIAKQKPPVIAPQPVAPQQTPVTQSHPVSAEDAELIANLDIVENMDVIENYDNVENLDVALLGSTEEKAQ